MTGNRVCIFLLVLATGCGPYSVQGLECHIAREPIIITGENIYSAHFTWNCTLMLNESIEGMGWIKDNEYIANVSNGTLQIFGSYNGRVELFERCGISINNISQKDSGHYKVVIILKGDLTGYEPCHPTYLLVLPEHGPEFKERTSLNIAKGKQFSESEQQGPSKLEIGLICGILPLTVVNGLGGVVWYFRRKRRNASHIENQNTSPELFPLQTSA